MAKSLFEETVKLIKPREDIASISCHTGLAYDWLIKLKRGNIKDPSVNKIQKLYEYLSGTKLLGE
mgnify:FL=1